MFEQNTAVYKAICMASAIPTEKARFTYLLLQFTFGAWIPMIIILFIHVSMFAILNKQNRLRARSTTSDTSQQLQSISRTFLVIVCAFYVCLLPFSLLNIIIEIPKYKHLLNVYNYAIVLVNLNSCINPFIYTKIHHKIYKGARWVLGRSGRAFHRFGSWLTQTRIVSGERASREMPHTSVGSASDGVEGGGIRVN